MARLFALALVAFTCTGLIHGNGEGESEHSDRFVSSLIQHLNSAPGRTYVYEEGTLVSAQRRGEHVYDVEANVRAVDPSDAQRYKLLTCRGQLVEDEFAQPPKFIVGESSGCHETEATIVTAAPILLDRDVQAVESDEEEGATEVEPLVVQRAVHLDHEVLPTNEATSGEQFVAVRREHGPGGACAGCASLVDPAAPGVDDLARLALRHIDRHDAERSHRLARILTVERQVQVVNGVRYILTLDVDFDNCSFGNFESCAETKTCKVSILEKPWLKLPNGSKFRAIISNNCTDEYLFGDNGEVLPTIAEDTGSNENRDNEIDINFNPDDNGRDRVSLPPRPTPDYDAIANSGSADDILKVIHSTQLQANIPPRERELTPEEMKHLEEQIIPTSNIDMTIAQEQKIYNTESTVTTKSAFDQLAVLPKQNSLSTDQQKALDGLMDYFSFDLGSSNTRSVRHTRNVDKADDPFVQTLANILVNTLNNLDVHVKNRVLQQVLTADEETTAGRHIFYIRAKVAFPDFNDETQKPTVKVCNAMFDASNVDAPRVLKSFCNEPRHSRKLGGREKVDVNSPEILLLINQALDKIESESTYDRKLKVINVLSADKQLVSGILTRLSLEIGLTDCLKSSTADISKCNLRMDRASTICKIHSLKQPWLKSNKITFECVDAPTPSSQTKSIEAGGALENNVNDPEIIKLAVESLQRFELTSDNTNRRKIVQIHSASTQVVSGYLTKILYDVALTKCTKGDTAADLQSCELLENTPRQRCQAEIWNRPWLKDGKRIEVICNNVNDVISGAKKKTHKVKRQLIGGPTLQNPEEFNDAAKESLKQLEQLEQLSPSQYKQKVVKVTKVTTQVVSGSLTKIDFDVAYTKCLSNDLTTSVEDCELLEDRPVRHCHSEIWNRSWLKNGKQITVTCNDESTKRTKRDTCGIPGGVCNVDVSPYHIQLAQESLQQLELLTNSEYRQKILNITSVQTQVVAGTLTKIDFHVAYTKCLHNDLNKNVDSECDLLTDKPTRICHSEIWDRPWIKDGKVITVDCDDSKKRDKRGFYEDVSNKNILGYRMNDSNRKKRDVGLTDVLAAEKAVDILNSRGERKNLLKFIKIRSLKRDMNNALLLIHFEVGLTDCLVGEQDVTKRCYLLEDSPHRRCHAKVWKRRKSSSMPNGDTSVYCDEDVPMHLRFMSGESWIENNSADKLVNRKLAQLALEQLNDTTYKMKVMKILSVLESEDDDSEKNIVFMAAFTNCSIDVPIAHFSECKVLKNKLIRLCQAEVWGDGNTSTIRCDILGKTKRSSSPDLPTRVDHNDELYRLLAKDSLVRLELSSNSSSRQKVVRVTSAEILPGDVRRIAFEAAYTVCSKYEEVKNVDTCEPLPNPPHRYCSAQIWRRDWLKHGLAIDVDCHDRDEIQSADYDTALQLAELSLKHVEAKYLHPNKQNVVRIVSFHRQVTSGIHYRMKFEVGYTNCLVFDDPSGCNFTTERGHNRMCKSNMWVRPQSDGAPNIRVTCELDSDTIPDDILLQLQAERLFHRFLDENRRDYVDDKLELAKRFNIFKDNIKRIHELNTRERGTAKYGVTRFADMTYEEFSKKRGGLRPDLRNENAVPMPQAVIKKKLTLPESFDWRTKGAVTEVKDQGQCGSCWAFSVTGNIEGQYQIAVGQLLSFSEQELIDCDSLDEGCNGGLPDNAYRAIEQLGGLEEEKAYPYDAEDEKCKYDPARVAVQITGAVNISSNETTMAEWLVQNGPISIGINANGMQFYMGGVSHPWKMLCNPKNLDHGVLIVGFGIKNYPLFHKTLPYWIVKNSWGPGWGESGYYRVFRGDGTCGLNTMASSAVVN